MPTRTLDAHSRRHMTHTLCARGVIAAVILVSAPEVAMAGVKLNPREVRSYDSPEGFDPRSAVIRSTREGTTVLAATTGSDANTRCEVVIVSDMAAASFTYGHNNRATVCLGIESNDEGFFLRGADPTALEGQVTGFTAYVDAEGNVRWAIDDQTLVDAKSEADGGTGEFLGVYVQPNPAMTYSAQFNKLLAFTDGKLIIGPTEKSVTQAHVVEVNTGRLAVTGQTFGQNAIGIVGGAATRVTDGYFLLYLYSSGDQGAFFYSYNGRNRIAFFQPDDVSWEDRVVTGMVYGPEERLTLLWTPNSNADADTRITSVDDEGLVLWEGQWSPEVQFDNLTYMLGRPLGMWVGDTHTMVLYSTGAELFARVVLTSNGQELGVTSLANVTPYTPIAILDGEDGGLKLLAWDDAGARLHEYALDFEEVPDEMMPPDNMDMGSSLDMGGSSGEDMGSAPDMGDGGEDEGCGCRQLPAPPSRRGESLLLLLVGCVAGGWRRMRRRGSSGSLR
ncbi:MAG: hypothetical protein VYE40_12030 [Myxococcota bacterium]|nr:hypothetical protein [Myxococcota bacterium]